MAFNLNEEFGIDRIGETTVYKSLNSKLVLIFIVFIIAVMATVGIFLMNSVFDFYTNDFSRQMEEGFNETTVDRLTDALLYENPSLAQKQILVAYSGVFGFDNNRHFYILDKNAKVLDGSLDDVSELSKTQNLISAMNKEDGTKQTYGADFLDYALYLENGGKNCIIYVIDDMTETKNLSFMLFSIIIRALIIGLIIALIMAFFLAKAITKPIQTITGGTKQISSGDYSHRLKIRTKDEIGTLAKNFNGMAQVIENTLEAVSGEREKLKNVFDTLDAGVAAFEEDGELIHINPSALSMLSFPENHKPSFDELTCALGIPEITMDSLKKFGSMHIEEQSLSEIATRELVVSIDIGVFGYDDGAAKSGFIVVFQNITQNALLEKNRREFIANVSHELRTPLTSVKGATETIIEDPDMPEAIKQRFLGIVINESDRMTRIVQDLLVLSRLDNRRMTWKPVKFDLFSAADGMCSALEAEAKAHGHTLTLEPEESPPMPIFADKERIEQVITNIIGNAIKYTPDGGKIAVKVFEKDDGNYVVSVSDTGVGIPEEDLAHIFERFYRVDKSRSTDAGGTGLGLSIAKDIIDAHGGEISMDSEYGKGTTVTITLPKDSRISKEA
ncbi:MAG: HAMP domain-containing protein [Clostridia bacterium]|nr:HAMP domain-containing protein [Clostridia bacterium]